MSHPKKVCWRHVYRGGEEPTPENVASYTQEALTALAEVAGVPTTIHLFFEKLEQRWFLELYSL